MDSGEHLAAIRREVAAVSDRLDCWATLFCGVGFAL